MEEYKELNALLKLLDEPDPFVYEQIRERILSLGADVIPQLEESWENTFDQQTQRRIEDIIHSIQFDQLKFELSNWLHFSPFDLLSGFLVATKYQYPELQVHEIKQKIEQIKWDVWLELNNNLTPLETIKVVNHVLFEIHKFGPNRSNPGALQNFFLNNLLESKRGNPLSMSLFYLSVCQRLGLPVTGVDLPQHYILAWTHQMPGESTILPTEDKEVSFYINPYKKGTVFTRREVDLYLSQLKIESRPEYYSPSDPVTAIRRLLEGMAEAYKYFQFPQKVSEIEELLHILD